jgi:hypothetical protein
MNGYQDLKVTLAQDIVSPLQSIHEEISSGADAIVIDTAHGHSKYVIEKLREAKASFQGVDIVVGNVATGDAARMLYEAGADAVKVGIGPGSICTTRVVAGVGVPQLSAVYDVAQALKGTGVPLIADGGLRYSGDIVKALAAGGFCVMIVALSLFAYREKKFRLFFKRRRYVICILIVLLLTFMAVTFAIKKDSALGRFHIWNIECKAISKMPLTGYGYNTVLGVYGEDEDFDYEYEDVDDEDDFDYEYEEEDWEDEPQK